MSLPALHDELLEDVLVGRDLERTAALAAPEAGGTVAIVVPAAGVAVAWPPRSAATITELRRYAAQRLDGGPAAVPAGLALERPVGGGIPGIVLLLDAATDRSGHAAAVLHLVATTARVALALDDGADGGHVPSGCSSPCWTSPTGCRPRRSSRAGGAPARTSRTVRSPRARAWTTA